MAFSASASSRFVIRHLSFVILLSLGLVAAIGCEKAPPPPVDLANAPWLDPKAQIEGLVDGDLRIRAVSARNLGNIGAPAAIAITKLEELAKNDPEPKVREHAVEALEKIRGAQEKGASSE